jgi:SAM-dependent methyltransferase
MKREWWESGFFDMEMAAVLFDPERLAAAKKEVAGLRRLVSLKPGAEILDAACGVGRHSLELAAAGFRVTGVDISHDYVAEAQKQARRRKLKADFEQGDLRDLYRFHGQFDLVINLFTSFGYYQNPQDNLEALRQMASALKPGGRLVMDILCREALDRNFLEKDWDEIEGGGYLLHQRTWVQGGRKIRTRNVIFQHGRQREAEFEIFLYTSEELTSLFKRAGLKNVKRYADLQGRKWNPEGRTVLIGEKS